MLGVVVGTVIMSVQRTFGPILLSNFTKGEWWFGYLWGLTSISHSSRFCGFNRTEEGNAWLNRQLRPAFAAIDADWPSNSDVISSAADSNFPKTRLFHSGVYGANNVISG